MIDWDTLRELRNDLGDEIFADVAQIVDRTRDGKGGAARAGDRIPQRNSGPGNRISRWPRPV